MGRSVSVPSGAAIVTYAGFDCEDDAFAYDDFQFLLEDMRRELAKAFKSVYDEDKWIGYGRSEDHAIAANRFAYFGVSEYCGLVSCWVVPKDSEHEGIRDAWIASITKTFLKVVENVWGTRYAKLGSMSNGEGVYQKVGA